MILVEDFLPNQLFEKYFLSCEWFAQKNPIRCVKAFTPHFLHSGTLWCYNNSHIFLPVWQLCQQDVDGLCKYLYLQTCFSFSHHENCLQGLYCGGRALHTAALSSTSEQLITLVSLKHSEPAVTLLTCNNEPFLTAQYCNAILAPLFHATQHFHLIAATNRSYCFSPHPGWVCVDLTRLRQRSD